MNRLNDKKIFEVYDGLSSIMVVLMCMFFNVWCFFVIYFVFFIKYEGFYFVLIKYSVGCSKYSFCLFENIGIFFLFLFGRMFVG